MQFETWAESDGTRARLRFNPEFIAVSGTVTFIELLPVGAHVEIGDAIGLAMFAEHRECEISTPVAGNIVAVNEAVHIKDPPSIVNDDPQGSGWLVEIDTSA